MKNPMNYPEWYTYPAVKFEIIKSLFNREFSLFKPKNVISKGRSTRTLRVHSTQHLDIVLRALKVFTYKKYNLYYSLGKYKNGIPYQTLDLGKRDNTDWKKNHWKEMVSYDLFIDIDAGNHNDVEWAHISARYVKEYMDKNNYPYSLIFSGRGFHFITPYHFLPQDKSFDPDEEDNIYKWCKQFAIELKEDFTQMIDLSVYDCRRVCKIPYSISLYKNENYLCWPINSHSEFDSFDLGDMTPERKFMHVGGRGIKLFNQNGTSLANALRRDRPYQ